MLLLLTVFGPISMDLYLPLLPELTVQLGTAVTTAQLTVTACLIGLALGQLVAGPVSDRYGRSRPLYVGVAVYVLTSLLCAISPSIELLLAARLLQGMAGGVGLVIAQAAGRDVYSGADLIRFYGRVTVVSGLAAVVGPLLGGVLAGFTDWRGLFVFLGVAGAGILLVLALRFRETLPPHRRTAGGLGATLRTFRILLADRLFLSATLVQGFVNAALFAYLASATYVLQDGFDLSPQQYALAFGVNSAVFALAGHLSAGASERWGAVAALRGALCVAGLGAGVLLVAGFLESGVLPVLAGLVVLVAGVAATMAPTTTMALAEHPQAAGSASSLLGVTRFGFGAVGAPLVGIGAASTSLPLGVVAVAAVVLAGATHVMIGRGSGASPTQLASNDAAVAHDSSAP